MRFLNRKNNGSKKGIYCIKNIKNNKMYIGATSRNFRSRYSLHNSLLRRNKHNSKFQRDYNEFGDDCFVFEILFVSENNDEIIEKENEFIRKYNSIEEGYNCAYNIPGGLVFSENTRSKISESTRKRSSERKMTEENRIDLSKANKGIKRTEEEKEHLSIIFSGKNSNFAVLTEDEVVNIKRDFIDGMSIKDISKKYKISVQNAKEIKYNLRWKYTEVEGWKEFQMNRKHPRALTDDEYNDIIEMIKNGDCNNKIAKKHHISFDRIKNIRKKLNA